MRLFGPALIVAAGAAAIIGLTAHPALAAGGESFDFWWKTSWRIINFLILVALIYKVAKEPARAFFKDKREEAEQILAELEEAKAKAQAELDELKAKLANAEQEIAEIVEQLKVMAARNRESIIEEARRLADDTLTQAQMAAESELVRARQELIAQSGEAVIASAAEKLKSRLTPADHERIVNETLARLEASGLH